MTLIMIFIFEIISIIAVTQFVCVKGAFTFPSAELTALQELYNSTDGSRWTWKIPLSIYGAKWNFTQASPNPCTEIWQGISCTSKCTTTQCNVKTLELAGYQMRGNLPNSLNSLTHLTILEFSDNSKLVGTIPTSIMEIITLQQLTLSNNGLIGSIPSNIGSLINLHTLNVASNQLTSTFPTSMNLLRNLVDLEANNNLLRGSISSDISALTSLQTFNIHNNNFTGSIPDSIYSISTMQDFQVYSNKLTGTISNSVGNWKQITYLDYYGNFFTGTIPESTCDLVNVGFLSMKVNELVGTVPNCIGNLQVVTTLLLNNNNLTGTIPENITLLKSVDILTLSSNKFSGSIPNNIGNLRMCTQLDFAGNNLDGTIPASIGQMLSLSKLFLDINDLHGTIPAEIVNCRNLTELRVDQNRLTGSLPDDIGNLQKLLILGFSTNNIGGTIPESIGELRLLREFIGFNNSMYGKLPNNLNNITLLNLFQVDSNYLSGRIPPTLFLCKDLKILRLDKNEFTGTIPLTIENGRAIVQLAISFNYLVGTIPKEVQQLERVEQLEFGSNELSGTIPEGISNLRNALSILLFSNKLTGTIPTSITSMKRLVTFDVFNNRLNGTIPANIGNMTRLSELELIENHLTGSIPPSIVNCKQLKLLNCYGNKLTGSLPAAIGDLDNLIYLSLNYNRLTGTIPPSLFTTKFLNIVYLASNFFSGPIPSTFAGSHLISEMNFGINLLTGTIPANIGEVVGLSVVYLMFNELEGSIPGSLYSLNQLQFLYLFYNQLSGSISNSVVNMNNLRELDVHHNFLDGVLPTKVFALPLLYIAYFDENSFTGSIPFDGISGFSRLVELLLNDNMFSGTLSSSIGKFPLLISLNISTNSIVGTVPSTASNLKLLEILDISYNEFSGSLTNIFTDATRLRLFFAESNRFTGALLSAFNISTQRSLTFLDLSNNQLTGSISAEFFIAQNMSSFAVVKNCLTGSIPEEICTNRFLVSLAMDGLHTADSCQRKIFPGLPSYFLDNAILGTIPACLFEMERLSTLHLSGNGIEGTIPSDVLVSSSLTDLSLSHNQLSGSIPAAIQQHYWVALDLSFNKLSGKLMSNIYAFDSNQSLTLDVNRLSGAVPNTLVSALDINILRGNLFGCSFNDRNDDLPKHDEFYDSYQCGSNSINTPMYVWAGILFLVVPTIIFIQPTKFGNVREYVEQQPYLQKIRQWWAVFRGAMAINSFGDDLAFIRRVCGSWVLMVVLILLPLYCTFRVFYSTHEFTYAWFLSLAYVAGKVPAATSLTVLLCVLLWVEYHMQSVFSHFLKKKEDQAKCLSMATHFRENSCSIAEGIEGSSIDIQSRSSIPLARDESTASMSDISMESSWKEPHTRSQNELFQAKLKWGAFSLLAITFNLFVVLAVNAAYVFSITNALEPFFIGVITFAITVFKIFWSMVVVADIICGIFQKTLNAFVESAFAHMARELESQKSSGQPLDPLRFQKMESKFQALTQRYERRVSRFLIYLSLFNSVVAPCLAVLLVSPECFYYVITRPDEVSVAYQFLQCDGIYNTLNGFTCVGKSLASHSTSYSPAFSYSYQCTSSILANFVDIYLYRYLVAGVFMPLVFYLLKRYQEHLYRKTGSANLFYVVSAILPVAVRIIDLDNNNLDNANHARATDNEGSTTNNPLANSVASKSDDHESLNAVQYTNNHPQKRVPMPVDFNQVFIGRRFTTILVGDLAIMLTFGAIYPPVAVVVFITVVLNTINVQVVLGRFVSLATNQLDFLPYVATIKRETAAVGSLIALSIAPISVLATIFWSFFLFDVLADNAGVTRSLWILFILPFCLLFTRLCLLVFNNVEILRTWFPDRDRTRSISVVHGIELRNSATQLNHIETEHKVINIQ